MSVSPKIAALPDSNDSDSAEAGAPSVDALLRAARGGGRPSAWAWYRAGEQLHLAGRGDGSLDCAPGYALDWPQSITEERLAHLCAARGWHRWPTGRGE